MVFSERNSVKALFFLVLISLFAYSLQNAELDRLTKKSKDFTFAIESEEDWENFIEDPGSERNENVLILLTVGPDMRHQCPFCGQFRTMFGMLSVLFNKRHKEDAPRPIYFGVLEYKRSTASIIQNLGIKQVPSVLMYTPGSSKPYIPDLQKQNLHDAIAEHMDVTIDVTNVEEFAHLFEGEGGAQARQGGSSSSAMQIASASTILVLVLSVGSLIINFWHSKQHLLIVGSFFIYVLCAGGGIFNLLNGPPPFYMNPQTGSPVFFMPQMQAQFAFEGFIASTTMIVCSICFIALTQFLPSVHDPVAKRMYGYAIMLVFGVSFLALVIFFLLKSPWYLNDSPLWPVIALIRAIFIGS